MMISRIFKTGMIFLLTLPMAYPAFPQNEMSLEDCIRLAIDRNIGIARQGLQVDLSRDNLQTSQAGRLPEVQGFIAHNLSSGKTVNYENYTYINTKYQDGNAGLQGSLNIFSGLGTWYLTKSARYALLSETEKKDELQKALTIDVTAAYLQILYSDELLTVAKAKLETSGQQLTMNEGLFDAGRMSKVDVLSIKSQVAQDRLAVVQAENDLRTAYLTLSQLLNMSDDEQLRIRKPLNLDASLSLEVADPAMVLDYAMQNHPGIRSAKDLVTSRESGLSAARSRISPSLSLNGIVYSRYSELGVNPLNPSAAYPYADQLKDNLYGRASLNVSIPIFSQFQTRSRISQARIQSLDAKLQLDQKVLSIRQDIRKAYTAALNAKARYDATSDAIVSAQETFNLTAEKYKAGIASSVDFKVAQNQLIQAQSTRIQSKYEFIIRLKILDLYLDKPITL